MQLYPMPEEALLAGAYADAASEAYIVEEAGQRETARRALEQIESHAPGRGRLLDLGCWVGFLLAEARDRGWRTAGVEPSEFASAYARERLGLEVITGDLLATALPAGSFDAVAMGDVIEHLVIREPRSGAFAP
jgi:SAM-dependent methyltransferase